MIKYIGMSIITIAIIIVYFNFKGKVYDLKEESFYVQDKRDIKSIINSSEKLILNTKYKTFIGRRTLFPINKNLLVIELLDGIYLYNTLNYKIKKILNEGFNVYGFSNSYKSLIVLNQEKLYLFNINDLKLKILRKGIEKYNYSTNTYNNPILMNNDEILYRLKSNKIEVFNIKKNTAKHLQKSIFQNCYPLLNIMNKKYICKKKNEFYILNTNTKNLLKLSNLNIYTNYMYYIDNLNAIMYTKLNLEFFSEKLSTRIYFLDDNKDFLWSDKYFQPVLKQITE